MLDNFPTLLLVSLTFSTTAGCPSGTGWFQMGDHCYYMSHGGMDWFAAEQVKWLTKIQDGRGGWGSFKTIFYCNPCLCLWFTLLLQSKSKTNRKVHQWLQTRSSEKKLKKSILSIKRWMFDNLFTQALLFSSSCNWVLLNICSHQV